MPERVRFKLDGRPAEADADASLLAALWNQGLRAVRTSVSGAPRGPLCAMGTCFECRVGVDGEPYVRACLTRLRDQMSVVLDASVPAGPESAVHEATAVEAEVVVVGAGPAGLAAAVRSAEAGVQTLLVDASPRPGGQIWRHRRTPPRAARPWLARLERSGAGSLNGTVVDADRGELLIASSSELRQVRYRRLVLANGARELFLPFPGWTRPGVVGVGAAQALLKAGASFEGLRVVVAGSGPLLLAVAAALAADGARVVGVAEQAPLPRLAAFGAGLWRTPAKLAEGSGYAARLLGAPYRTGAWLSEVDSRDGALRATLGDGTRAWAWDCDVVAIGYGLVANLELPRLVGCSVANGRVATGADQQTSVAGVFACGELCAIAGVDHALVSGEIAGLAAAGRDVPERLRRRRDAQLAFAARLGRAFGLRDELRHLARPDTLVCRCEDVESSRLESFASLREAKLATRAGMGPCQGRVCGPALGFLRGFEPDSVRPPLAPTPLAALACERLRPARGPGEL